MRLSKKFLILLPLIITACSQPLEYTQPPTPQAIRIGFHTMLSPLADLIQFCISERPEDYFVIHETPLLPRNNQTDLVLWLGEKPTSFSFAAPIGWESISIVLNLNNPLNHLRSEDVRALFSGNVTNWKQLEGEERPVSVWVYPEEDAIQHQFASFLEANRPFTSLAFLATNPAIVIDAVSSDPGAIGFIPTAWIDARVKPVRLEEESPTLPVLVLSPTEPMGAARDFIACLQSQQGQAVLKSRYQPWDH